MSEVFHVFGYGSLMWRPGFAHVAAVPALLAGSHRSLCVYSWVHRGTQEAPGLVFGLDRGGACRGIAFAVPADRREEVVAYLRAREQVTMVYREVTRPVRLMDGTNRIVPALAYVIDRAHPQYAGRLPVERRLEIVRAGRGVSGANPDYVLSTAAHMRDLGIRDPEIEAMVAALGEGESEERLADVPV